MKHNSFHIASIVIAICICFAGSAVAKTLFDRPLQALIDCPTAGGPETGAYSFNLAVFPDGGLRTGFDLTIIPRVTFGLSYGGTKIVSAEHPLWDAHPGFVASVRILNETRAIPALSAGYTSIGHGWYDKELDRYQYKARGLYVVLAKNGRLAAGFGDLSLSFGINRNPVEPPRKLDFFAGAEWRPFDLLGILAEYSPALDDRSDSSAIGLKRGYLNLAARFNVGERIALDLVLRDVLVNQPASVRGGAGAGREVRITYVEQLFKR